MKKTYRYFVFMIVGWLCLPAIIFAQERNLLSRFSTDEIARSLLPREQWKPFPKTAGEWQKILPDSVRKSIVQEAEKYRQAPFESIPASLMLEYQRTGIRINYENVSLKKRAQLFTLLLAEIME